MIISVRTIPRPRKARSSSSAMPNPMTRLTSTTETVSTIVVQIADRVSGSVNTVT